MIRGRSRGAVTTVRDVARNYNRITDKRQTLRSCLFVIGEKYGNQSKTERSYFCTQN